MTSTINPNAIVHSNSGDGALILEIREQLTNAATDITALQNGTGVVDDFTIPGDLRVNGTVGFYDTAPVAKPTVTGSRGSNAALASLLTALASQGLITDSTS